MYHVEKARICFCVHSMKACKLQLIEEKKLQVPTMHAVIVGSDMTAQTKFESELRNFVVLKKFEIEFTLQIKL